MKMGIIGIPGSGRTTVFDAMTGQSVGTGFGGKKEVHLGTVKVPDDRLDWLTEAYKPKKITHAEIVFVDVDDPSSEDFRVEDLQELRDADAFTVVLRVFRSEEILHPAGSVNALRDLENIESELILNDLAVAEKRVERLAKEGNKGPEYKLLELLLAHLNDEKPLRVLELSEQNAKLMLGFQFLSAKPMLVLLNGDDTDLAEPVSPEIQSKVADMGVDAIRISAELEQEIAQLPPDEQAEFLADLGVEETSLPRFIRAAYKVMNLMSFLTAGEKEVRAWTIRKGMTAAKAAGVIHSDIERGFIRAETVAYDDLHEAGTISEAKNAGRVRLEGKEYVVKDGDVLLFRFNV